MPPPLPPGYADVVRSHHSKTVGYLLALTQQCRQIVVQEIDRVRRNLRPLEPSELPRFGPKGSWFLAVLLGPESDAAGLVSWVKGLPAADRDRLVIYYVRGTELADVLRSWVTEGLGSPAVFEIRDFVSFHKVFGRHLNDRVWLDHA